MYQIWKDGCFVGVDGTEYMVAALIESTDRRRQFQEPVIRGMYFEKKERMIVLCLEMGAQKIFIKEEEQHRWYISGHGSPYRINKSWKDILEPSPRVPVELNEGISELVTNSEY